MKNLRNYGASVILILILSVSGVAGIMETPPCAPPGQIESPPCSAAPGQTETPPSASMDPGEMSAPPAEYAFTQLAITLLENAVFF